MRTQWRDVDIVVVGGGLAGVCAAVAAARLGRKVALINNRPVLGGNSSSEVRVWVCGATAHGNQRWARESGIVGEMYVENQYRNPEGNPIYWDDVVLDTVRREPNIELFLNTDVREVEASGSGEDRLISSVTGWTMGSEITTVFRSPVFLDCTGDGLIGELAGARYRLGKEGRAEFDEPWAPEEPVREFLGSTLLFYTRDAGRPVKYVPPETTIDVTRTAIPESRIIRSGDSGAHYWWIEWGGQLDIVGDNERIRDELRGVVLGIWDFIKNSGKFDAETLTLEWVGNIPGKREYRRLIGDYTLTQHDVLQQRRFDDSVAFGGWSIDLHPPEGMYHAGSGAVQRFSDGIFEIPYRCLYSVNVRNMLMAGRDFSATHVAFGAARVMATCGVMGEAAGTAAAMCVDLGLTPRELGRHHVTDLRQLLLRQDASVLGVANEDPADLARTARVSASSTTRVVAAPALPGGGGDGAAASEPGDGGHGAARSLRAELLDVDRAVVLPVDPHLEHIDLLLEAEQQTTVEVELWSVSRPQNAVPHELLLSTKLSVQPGRAWARAVLGYRGTEPRTAIVIVRANSKVSWFSTDIMPPGVLSLTHRNDSDDQNVEIVTGQPLLAWPTKPLRGRALCFRAYPASVALAPERATGGYARPFSGPNMWASAPMRSGQHEWLRLDWDEPVQALEIVLVFDDDVDLELNTLHHHRSPHEVLPQIVRDYRVELLPAAGGESHSGEPEWREIAVVAKNRRRRRSHDVADFGPFVAARLVIEATNGIPEARVVQMRVQAAS